MEFIIAILLMILNFPVYRIIFNCIFKDADDFRESVKHSFTPDLISLFRGKYWKDQFGEAKLSVFIFVCVIVVVLEFIILKSVINLFL